MRQSVNELLKEVLPMHRGSDLAALLDNDAVVTLLHGILQISKTQIKIQRIFKAMDDKNERKKREN